MKWKGSGNPPVGTLLESMLNQNFTFGTNATEWDKVASRYRPVAASLTSYLDSSSLYDSGMVYACQSGIQTEDRALALDTTTEVNWHLNDLPTDASEVLQMSAKPYSGKAKDGCFSVLRSIDPAVQYRTAQPAGTYIYGTFHDNVGSVTTFAKNLGKIPHLYEGFSYGVHVFKGIDNRASLSLKVCHSYEVTTESTSAWNPFLSPGPAPDSGAMELAAIHMHEMPDGMPAAMNDFGSFIRTIGRGLASVWNFLKPVAGSLTAMIPRVGPMMAPMVERLSQQPDIVISDVDSKPKTKKKKKKKSQATKPHPSRKGS
jgi:hypothetical protein